MNVKTLIIYAGDKYYQKYIEDVQPALSALGLNPEDEIERMGATKITYDVTDSGVSFDDIEFEVEDVCPDAKFQYNGDARYDEDSANEDVEPSDRIEEEVLTINLY